MSILVSCPSCNSKIKIPPKMGGKSILCPKCGKAIALPAINPPSGPTLGWGAPAFVWSIWAILLLAALIFVAKYHTGIPFGEDWDQLVTYLTGETPVTISSLWTPIVEHRPFLARAVQITFLQLCGGYYWGLMLFHVLSLGALTFGMIYSTKQQRGWTSYPDAFFPLALLHWLFSSGLFDAVRVCCLLPTIVAGTVLVVMVQKGMRLTRGAAILAGICMILLPLCSTYGLVYMPALLAWYLLCAVLTWRSPKPKSEETCLLMLALATVALVIVTFYFVGLNPPGERIVLSGTSLWMKARGSLGMLTTSFGPVGALWPFSGFAMLILLAVSTGILVAVIRRKPYPDHSRALAFLFFLGACVTLALAYGWGRVSPDPENPVELYYYVLSVPVLCCIYSIAGSYRPETIGYFVQMCLFTVMAFAFSINTLGEFAEGKELSRGLAAFEKDLQEGLSPYMLLARHSKIMGPHVCTPDEALDRYMHGLHRAGVGPFRNLKEDPVFDPSPLPSPTEISDINLENGIARVTGPAPYVTFVLPFSRFVAGVCIKEPPTKCSSLQVSWKGTEEPQFPPNSPYSYPGWPPYPLTIYIADRIDQIRIDLDPKAGDFNLSDIYLLIPETKRGAGP